MALPVDVSLVRGNTCAREPQFREQLDNTSAPAHTQKDRQTDRHTHTINGHALSDLTARFVWLDVFGAAMAYFDVKLCPK